MKMRKFISNKLWRDKNIQKVKNWGSVVHTKRLTDAEYDAELRFKLIEEAQEVKSASTQNELMQELADIFEVVDALCLLHNIKLQDITNIKEKKREEQGSFEGRNFVTIAEHVVGGPGEKYCLAQPDKYPELIEE